MHCSWLRRRAKQTSSRSIGGYVQSLTLHHKIFDDLVVYSRLRWNCCSSSQQTKPACVPSSPAPSATTPTQTTSTTPKRTRRFSQSKSKVAMARRPGFSIMFAHLGRKFYQMLSVGGSASQLPQVDYTAAGPHVRAEPVLCTLGRHFPVGEPRELRGPAQ